MDLEKENNQPQRPNYRPQTPLSGALGAGKQDQFDLLLCFRVLLSYWWILGPLAVFGAFCGISFWLKVQPVYQAFCRFEVFENQNLNIGKDIRQPRGYENAMLYRHILVMQSGKLNSEVSDKLAVDWGGRIPEDFDRYQVDIAPVKDAPGSMLDISIESFSTEYSLAYLKKLIEGYQSLRREENSLLNESTVSNLRVELDNLATKLEVAENDIAEFEAEHNIYFVHEKYRSDQALLTKLMKRQSELRTQSAILESQYPFLQNENAATLRDVLDLTNHLSRMEIIEDFEEQDALIVPGVDADKNAFSGWSENPDWRKNEADIMRLNNEYEKMLETYKPGHDKMTQLQERIDLAKRELRIQAQISLKRLNSIKDALKMQEEALLKTAQSFRMEINMTAGDRAEYDKLKRRQQHLKKLYDQVFGRIIDGSTSSQDKYYSRFIDGPYTDPEPVWPIRWQVVTMSIIGFVGLGSGIILLSYFIRVKLYDYQTLERNLNIDCLAGVPKFKNIKFGKKRSADTDVVLKKKTDFASECYRSLRTQIEYKMNENDKVLMITSPDPGEGKTFSVMNLAMVFSWNRKKVLLVDGDFRRMTFRKLFKNSSKEGLTDCLISGSKTWQDYVQKSVLGDVDYLPAGQMDQNITELLTLQKVKEIFAELREVYDLIILDSAPVNRVVDTIILAKQADKVMIVAKAGKTKIHSIQYCYNRLSSANVIGYILNNIDASSRKYGFYNQGYSYYSTYHQYKSYDRSDYGKIKEKQAEV